MKKLWSVLLTLTMLLTLAPVAIAADDFTPQREGSGIQWEGGTVTLTQDVMLTDRVFVYGDTTLDLNGYTINCVTDDNPFLIWGGATLTVTGDGTVSFDGQSALFIAINYRKEVTPPEYDEEGNLLQAETEQEVSAVGRLVLEGGTFNAQTGGVVYVAEGAEAQFGAAMLNGGIYNVGTISSITGTEISADPWAINSLGEIGTIKDCAMQGSIFVGQLGSVDLITGCKIDSSHYNKLAVDGTVGTVSNTVFTGVSSAFDTGTRATIDLIEHVEVVGANAGILNQGYIKNIKSSHFAVGYHGMENMGVVDAVVDCEFLSERYTSVLNHAAGSNLITHDNLKGHIGLISGGQFVKDFLNKGVVDKITGGSKFDQIVNEEEIGLLEDYTVDSTEYGAEAVGLLNDAKGVIDTLAEGTFIGTGVPIQNDGVIGSAFEGAIITGTGTVGGLPQEQPEEPTPEKETVVLTDMAGHWAGADVTALVEKGIVNGYPDGTFGPANNVTRGELCKMLVATKGVKTKGGEPLFADTKGTWSEKYVNALEGVLLPENYPDGFHQEAQATRVEVVTALMRAMGYDAAKASGAQESKKVAFSDMEGLTAEQIYYVNSAISGGILKGTSDGKLNPNQPISRAEIATMLNRVLERRK